MRLALDLLEQLLRQYGHIYEANLAAIARAEFDSDPEAACREINRDEWWNDRRSVAALDLAVDGGFTAPARRDAQALRQALIEVFATMRAYGEHNAAAEIVVAQFHKWIESRV
jgi:hypothetical protein